MLDESQRGCCGRAWILGLLVALASACGGDDTSSTAAGSAGSSAGGAGGSRSSGAAGSGTGGSGGSSGAAGASGAAGSAVDSSVDSADAVSIDAPGDGTTSDTPDVAVHCGAPKEPCCAQGAICASDSGATLTCSVDFCLNCSDVPAFAPGCTNVALTGVVTAQREVLPDDAAIHANDGNVCTAWSSADYADIRDSGVTGTFLQIDLMTSYTLNSMTFWIKSTPNDANVTLKFEYSTDGVTWMPWQSPTGFSRLLHDNDPWITPFEPPITARYFKVTFLSSPSYIAMRELALFSCSAADAGAD